MFLVKSETGRPAGRSVSTRTATHNDAPQAARTRGQGRAISMVVASLRSRPTRASRASRLRKELGRICGRLGCWLSVPVGDAAPDLSDRVFHETLLTLAEDDYIEAQVMKSAGEVPTVTPMRLMAKGRRAVGQWPVARRRS
jgi:hypothetical protein